MKHHLKVLILMSVVASMSAFGCRRDPDKVVAEKEEARAISPEVHFLVVDSRDPTITLSGAKIIMLVVEPNWPYDRERGKIYYGYYVELTTDDRGRCNWRGHTVMRAAVEQVKKPGFIWEYEIYEPRRGRNVLLDFDVTSATPPTAGLSAADPLVLKMVPD